MYLYFMFILNAKSSFKSGIYWLRLCFETLVVLALFCDEALWSIIYLL